MTTFALTQSGTSAGTGFSDAAAGPISFGSTAYGCIRFQVIDINASTQRLTEPVLQLTHNVIPTTGRITVYADLRRPAPAIWGGTYVPDRLDLSVLAVVTGVILTTSTTIPLSSRISSVIEHSDNNGFVNVALWAPTTAVNNTTFTLTATAIDSFTGLEGYVQAWGRADRCPKCGLPSTRDTWVRDGYLRIMVCPACYDEPDPVGRQHPRQERPGIGED